MTLSRKAIATSLTALVLAAGCSGDPSTDDYAFSSDQAVLLEMEFDGELVADSVWSAERSIEDQLLYTIGHLNGDRSVGRLDKLELSNVERVDQPDGTKLVKYHVKLPVAWGRKTSVPQSYTFRLPRHVDQADYESFVQKYGHSCVDHGAHDVDSGSMWYYYRPNQSGCQLADEDVFTSVASVKLSDENTEGRYPEYHKVWEDGALSVVAIFGKYEDGATTASDAGISAYNRFVKEIGRKLAPSKPTTTPETVPQNPGVQVPDITFRATLADGKTIEVVALLVDNVRTAGPEFDARYEGLSGDADMIFYNGHAGLGSNVRALAKKGKFKPGKYQIFFMNGCDSFAYVDGHLAQTRAVLNPDDPTGTRYMDMITNVMPSFFSSMPYASMALIDGLTSYASPKTYNEIFKNIDKSEVVVVTGEEDNVYEPGYQPGGSGWQGMEEKGSVGKGEARFFEVELPAGSYSFATGHDPAAPGGDVDLYVAVDRQPTTTDYDYRPYLEGSDESVTVKLEQAGTVHLMVYGYEWADSDSSAFILTGASVE